MLPQKQQQRPPRTQRNDEMQEGYCSCLTKDKPRMLTQTKQEDGSLEEAGSKK